MKRGKKYTEAAKLVDRATQYDVDVYKRQRIYIRATLELLIRHLHLAVCCSIRTAKEWDSLSARCV